jgi:para-aminobenzoate synthetase
VSTLLIDNHDSNTYNLFQLLAVIEGSEPVVVRNDEARWAQIDAGRFDRCVISPGPGRPDRPRDFGLSRAALDQARLPVLGVCLGHQGLALVHGGVVGPAPAPMHGRRSSIHHDGSGLFRGIPQGFRAVRYHSLAVHEPLPDELEVIARTRSGTVMALRHRRRPHWGVQFHPESVHTEWGERLLRNFVEMTPGRGRLPRRARAPRRAPRRPRLELVTRTVRRPLDAERAFAGLFGSAPNAFWLDSAAEHRWSYMGAGSSRLQHRVGEHPALVERLARALEPVPPGGPAPFTGGWVGYLGYELKAEFGAAPAHRSPLPDAQLLRAERLVAYDHRDDEAHVICLCEPGARAQSAEYADHLARRLRVAPAAPLPRPPYPGRRSIFTLARSPEDYLEDIATCQAHLRAGESYEICLTNELRGPRAADALGLYRVLRAVNPAPFAAFLRLEGVEVLSSSPERFLSVGRDGRLEAKPIKGTAARGATPQEDRDAAEALRRDGKDRAENLMIVDVLRNDLGRVAAIGSVEVPTLMGVETYETVHQLVSTVRARLRPGATILDCLRAAFPGGSMTGAPKLRTMELIDELEGRPRGIYSGAIGWIGASGDSDLSIAIRTIVNSAAGMTIGAGGAITVQSDPQAELDELLLKARAPLEAVGLALHGERDAAALAPAARAARAAR